MKSENWELIKFAIKLNLRYHPRLWAAPLVGALRNTQQVVGQMSAELDKFIAQQNQRAANGPHPAENAVKPATSEQPH